MKTILLWAFFLTLGVVKSWGQTCGCPFIGSYEEPPSFLVPDFTTSWQYLHQFADGTYTVFQVTNGVTYEWSYCAPGSIVPSGYDLRLNLYRCIATPCTGSNMQSVTCNGDYCGLNPRISWTATFSGNVYLQINNYVSSANPCNASVSSSVAFTLGFRILSGCGLTNITPTIISPGTSSSPGPIIANTTPTLTWNSVSGATNYGVFVRDIISNILVIDNACATTATSYTIPSGILSNNKQYRWNVQANISCGSCVSLYASPLYFQTPSIGTLAVTYPNGGETLTKGQNYNVTWNSQNITGNIQIDLYKGNTNVLQLASSAANNGSYPFNPLSNLADDNDYKIGISAMNGSVSDFSNSNFTISGGCAIANITPTLVSPGTSFGPGTIIATTTPTLSWNPVAGATNYDVYVSISPYGSSNIKYQQICVSGTSLTIPTGYLTNGNLYRWNMQANVNCGSCVSLNSSPLYFQTQNLCAAVSITTQPTNQTDTVGSTATFSVSVSGTEPFSFSWYKNGILQTSTNTSSATNAYTTPTLTIVGSGDYYYCLIKNCSDTKQAQSNNAYLTVVTDVTENNNSIPKFYNLSQNHPNPFNPSTIIRYDLPKEGMVTIKIYDILGREVKTLVNEYKNAGSYNVEFNASNLSSGTYFYKITAGDFTEIKKLILLK